MAQSTALDLIDKQNWIDPVADRVQKAVGKAFEAAGEPGRKVKNFLHGTWLGHPLHSALTDLPVGAWSSAVVLDTMECVTGRKEYGRAADTAIGIGLAGAVGAALAGITDWHATDGRARKTGLIHGLMNLGAAALYGAALLERKNGSRETGQNLSWAAFGMMLISAFLGGKLVYEEHIGVDHTYGQQFPSEFTPVLAENELPEQQPRRVEVNGARVMLVRDQGKIHAIGEVCSHLGGPLAEGKLEDCTITCPWHGSRFDIADGHIVNGPATHSQPCLETRINGGQIEVRAARR